MSFKAIRIRINDLLLERGKIDFEIQQLRKREEQLTAALLYLVNKAGYIGQKSHLNREEDGLIISLASTSRPKKAHFGKIKKKLNKIGLKVEMVTLCTDLNKGENVVAQIMVSFDPLYYSSYIIGRVISEAYKIKEL